MVMRMQEDQKNFIVSDVKYEKILNQFVHNNVKKHEDEKEMHIVLAFSSHKSFTYYYFISFLLIKLQNKYFLQSWWQKVSV